MKSQYVVALAYLTMARLTMSYLLQNAACQCRRRLTNPKDAKIHTFSHRSFRKIGVKQFSLAESYSADESSVEERSNDNGEKNLLHPEQLGPLVQPKALSPSSIMEFKKCPQSFLCQYLYNIKQPKSLALAKGSMCHDALDKLFDLEQGDRTLENLKNLLRVSWSGNRLTDTYRDLFEISSDNGETVRDVKAEREWGLSALQLLDNYYQLEDPRSVARPNPLKREVWLHANLTVDPTKGATGYVAGERGYDNSLDSRANGETPQTFRVRGIVDRFDMVRLTSHEVAMRLIDYKTGKYPNLKYSAACNARIVEEALYQLKIYALLHREQETGGDLDLRYLRLFYLTSETGEARYLDLDLGETQLERDSILQEIHADLSNVWAKIVELVSSQDPKAFVGCDRSFCYCHECRERFVPGSLWQPS